MSPRTCYVICTNPRSGSWLLSEGLSSTGLAGYPREWFNNAEEQLHRTRWGMESLAGPVYDRYLEHVLEHGTTGNGLFGIKLHYYQFAELTKKLGTIEKYRDVDVSELLPKVFPNIQYIWLRRRDKARQAISYYRACSTDEWWSIDGTTASKRAESVAAPPFDARAIECLEQVLRQNDCHWQAFFEENEVTPLTVYYEDLAADYRGQIAGVLQWLGVPEAASVTLPPPRLRRQADGQTEDWLRQYLAVKGGNAEAAVEGEKRPVVGAVAPEDPLLEHVRKSLESISDPWKRWIGENKLRKTSDETIIRILNHNGYGLELAKAEVAQAASDPYLMAGEQAQQRLNKAWSVLKTLQKLSTLRPEADGVERRRDVSRTEFLERYYSSNRPVIVEGLMTKWRAMTVWTPEYLKSTVGDEPIEIMSGREADPHYELNIERHRKRVGFCEYVDMVFSGRETNDYYLVANNVFFRNPGALALLGDLELFTEYLRPTAHENQTFLWLGPAGTVTPLHHDTCNILMAQVAGRKRVRLIAPSQLQWVYNDISVYSRVDCENPDLERWPEFRNVKMLDVVLEPGEVLFLPVGWWHHVRSLDVSITVSFTSFVFPNQYEWFTPKIVKQ